MPPSMVMSTTRIESSSGNTVSGSITSTYWANCAPATAVNAAEIMIATSL